MLNLKVKNIESYLKYFESCSICSENPAFYRTSCSKGITFYSNKVHGGEQDSLAPERMTTASLFLGRHLMTCLNPPNPLFKGAHQGLRAFHRRTAALPANYGPASDDLCQSP